MPVFYPSIPASDGAYMSPAVNAVFEVFELSDAAYTTPLALVTTSGGNGAPLITTELGVTPPIYVDSPNLSHNFKSGSWVWRRDSFDGAAEAVETAKTAAVAAARAAEAPTDTKVDEGIQRANLPQLAADAVAESPTVSAAAAAAVGNEVEARDLVEGSDPRMPSISQTEDLTFAVRDADGNVTWLGVRSSDGGPTDAAVEHLQQRLRVGEAESPDYLFALADSDRNLTDLAIRASDGQFAEYVVDRLRPRILEGFTPATPLVAAPPRVYADAPWNPGSDVFPVKADPKRVVAWGSSSTEWSGGQTSKPFVDKGATYINEGRAGEWAENTAARMGSIPALMTAAGGTIPASGAVNMTSPSMRISTSLKPYAGTIAGVHGTLSSDGSKFIFTRTTNGTAATVPANSPMIPDLTIHRDASALLWMGKNNLTNGDYVEDVIRVTDASFDWMAPLEKRTLVAGHFVNTNAAANDPSRARINAVNAAHKRRYGQLFIDVQAYLISAKIWTDTSITPTAEDLAQQALGNKPPTLSADDGHLNATGYTAIATHLITPRLAALSWY